MRAPSAPKESSMRSVETERLTVVLLAFALGGCASVKEPMQSAQRAVKESVSKVVEPTAAAVAAAVPEAPVDPAAQRAFDDAKALLRAGRTAEAERAFKALAAQHPGLGGSHANLGLIARSAGRFDEAIAAGEAAVRASPRQPVFHNQLGLSYRMKGRFADARGAYERAIGLDANHADAHLNLGILLDLYLADNAAALAHYERYAALAPADAAVGKWIADIKGRNKQPASTANAEVKTGMAAAKEPR
jgi:Flp pilus assembly protein TadD